MVLRLNQERLILETIMAWKINVMVMIAPKDVLRVVTILRALMVHPIGKDIIVMKISPIINVQVHSKEKDSLRPVPNKATKPLEERILPIAVSRVVDITRGKNSLVKLN